MQGEQVMLLNLQTHVPSVRTPFLGAPVHNAARPYSGPRAPQPRSAALCPGSGCAPRATQRPALTSSVSLLSFLCSRLHGVDVAGTREQA